MEIEGKINIKDLALKIVLTITNVLIVLYSPVLSFLNVKTLFLKMISIVILLYFVVGIVKNSLNGNKRQLWLNFIFFICNIVLPGIIFLIVFQFET